MRRSLLLAASLACAPSEPSSDAPITPYDPLPYVNPFIGTGGLGAGIGALNPGAVRPFGMVHVGPESREENANWSFFHFGGYYWYDTHLSAFAHTHANGMGVNDFSTLAFMIRDGWSDAYTTEAGRIAPFSHDDEVARPGYYAVTLGDTGTRVELTATERTALHRYTFTADREPVVLLDLAHQWGTAEVRDGWAEVDLSTGTMTGYQQYAGGYSARFGGLQNYFVATFDPAPIATGTWTSPDDIRPGDARVEVPGGTWVEFPEGTTEVVMALGLSYVDVDGARANLEAELPDRDFDRVLSETEDAWRAELETVRVRGGQPDERIRFHTALYHASLWPNLISDVDGRYRGIDGEVHDGSGPTYTNFSLWDTYRTLHPWLILAKPERQQEMARSLVQMVEDGGYLPKWPCGHGYTGGMVGSPATQVLAETWLKGLRDWDADLAFDAALATASGPVPKAGRQGIQGYLARGYVALEDASGPASRTLEFAWSDHSLALWAEALGRPEAETIAAQSANWKNTWDPETGFFRGRYDSGAFLTDDDPLYWSDAFIEGGAWQYLWFVAWDVDEMIALQHDGDVEAFLERTDFFWEQSRAEPDDLVYDSWYWHGNEPDLHYAYLGALVGDLDRTARTVRYLLDAKYGSDADGLDGNDDAGTLSAWYLWSAIGLYPIGGTDRYALGSPIFDRIEIDRADRSPLVIRAPGASPHRKYIGGLSVDGETLWATTLRHDVLDSGDELLFSMSTSPSGWGAAR